jgi:hypothetical protein
MLSGMDRTFQIALLWHTNIRAYFEQLEFHNLDMYSFFTYTSASIFLLLVGEWCYKRIHSM